MPELQIAPEEKPKRQKAAKKTPRFQLGQRVEFTATVEKERNSDGVTWTKKPVPKRDSWRMNEDRQWQMQTKHFTSGVVIGKRTLSDYYISHETDYGEYGQSYGSYIDIGCIKGTGRLAWLVAFDMSRKPVLVLDEHVAAVCPVCGMTDNHYGQDPEKVRGWQEHHDDLCDGRWWPQE